MTNLDPWLSVTDLNLYTPDKRPLASGLDFQLKSGELGLVRGANGSGKTTLLRCLLGFWPHHNGGFSLSLPREQVAYLPQVQSPETHMPLSLSDVLSFSKNRTSESEILSLGLLSNKHLKYAWNTASGGEKKRTLLTRALLARPKLLILDEPFNHLDLESQKVVGHALRRFIEIEHGAVLMVSHEEESLDFFSELPIKRIQL